MQHIKFTHVDALTGVSVMDAPATGGPAMPEVAGLAFGFALESQYPTSSPVFYGTCADDADTGVAGVMAVVSQEEYDAALAAEMSARLAIGKARLADAATSRRWQVETGGIALPNGLSILTGKDDQDRVDTALNNMERYQLATLDFKAASGWVTVSYDELKAIGAAIVSHVQASFTAERLHHEAIAALASLDEVNQYDIYANWPANN